MSEADPAEVVPGVLARGLRAVRWGGAALCVGFGAWLACWTVYAGALWWAGLGAVVVWRVRWFRSLLYAVLGLSLVPWCLHRYDGRARERMAAVQKDGPAALSGADLVAVYGLNVAMGTAGYALGFPEVALETWRLGLPGADARRWRSDRFPVCAPRVAEVVERRRAQVRRGHEGPWHDRVAWKDYTPGPRQSVRAALALTPVEIVTRGLEGGLLVEATVPVDYPPSFRLVFGRFGPFDLAVEEGLFHAAEERGWLHPYRLTWEVQVPLEGPLPPLCEAWSIRLGKPLLDQISTATWPW